MRHSSIIPDKDLTCKIDFNGKQQQQTDSHTHAYTHMCTQAHMYMKKTSILFWLQRSFLLLCKGVFVICNFTVIRFTTAAATTTRQRQICREKEGGGDENNDDDKHANKIYTIMHCACESIRLKYSIFLPIYRFIEIFLVLLCSSSLLFHFCNFFSSNKSHSFFFSTFFSFHFF